MTTSVVGMVCGALGLAATVAWPRPTIEWHLWELAMMPVLGVATFWLILARQATGEPLLDELQVHTLAEAGGAAIAASIVGSFVASVFLQGRVFDPTILHPYNLCLIVFVYSLAARLRFRRG